MQIIFYHSFLCPRCHMAKKHLRNLAGQNSDLTIIEVDVTLHPVQAWRAGVRLIPALQRQDETLAGVYLTYEQIRNFVDNTR